MKMKRWDIRGTPCAFPLRRQPGMVFQRHSTAIAVVVEQFFSWDNVHSSDQQQMRSVLNFDDFRNQISLRSTVIYQPAQAWRFGGRIHATKTKNKKQVLDY